MLIAKRLSQSWRAPEKTLKLLALVILLTGIASCASAGGESKMYFHSFSFDVIADAKKYGHPEVDILDYSYGDSGLFGTRPSKEAREMSSFFYTDGATGLMPRGDFLYVKWRTKATGQVYEDRVDLRHRLPADVANYGIHFLIDGAQLYVYAFPPYETKDAFGKVTVHVGQENVPVRGQTFRDVPYNRKQKIYPDVDK